MAPGAPRMQKIYAYGPDRFDHERDIVKNKIYHLSKTSGTGLSIDYAIHPQTLKSVLRIKNLRTDPRVNKLFDRLPYCTKVRTSAGLPPSFNVVDIEV